MADKPVRSLADLTLDPQNARQHNPRNIGMIRSALQEVGAARSIVIDEGGTVLAGNATIEAAAEAGIERVRVIDADGDEIIAVRRSGLTEEQKVRLALYDNRAAELATWNGSALLDIAEATDLTDTLFRPEELVGLFAPPRSDEVARPWTGAAEGAEVEEEPEAGVDDPGREWRGMPEYEHEDLGSEYRCIVHFRTEEDLNAFALLVGQKIPNKRKVATSIWYPEQPRLAIDGLRYTADAL